MKKPQAAQDLSYLELPARIAAVRMGTSPEALWQRLRRAPLGKNGLVQLGGGIVAFKRGIRSWIVRFPL
ncbi:MAG: hypothetical protein AMXMBFR56_73520 [Polyangiaceae bacterium]